MALTTRQLPLQHIACWLTDTLSSVGDALIATNVQGQILFLNPAAESMTGWSLEKALNRFSSDVLQLQDKNLGLPIASPLKEAFLEERVIRSEAPCVLISATGDTQFVDYTASPIRDQTGEVVGAVIVLRSVENGGMTQASVTLPCRMRAL